jgi:hypothetical protein
LVNLFWFFLILRILWRLVASWGQEVEDTRSDEDESEEEKADRQNELDALRKEQGALEEVEKPALFVNGLPVEGGVDAAVVNGGKR